MGFASDARNARTIAQAAIFWHSSAQALQASPQSLHSVTLGNLSHSFLQSLQIISTVFARWPVCSELTAARVFAPSLGRNATFGPRRGFSRICCAIESRWR